MTILQEFRLRDLVALATVHRCGSVTGAARQLNVTPSQVSKAITRLETVLNVPLVVRSSRGVKLTDAGLLVLPRVHRVMDELVQLRPRDPEVRTLTVAAPSFLNDLLVPGLAGLNDNLRIRALELAPALIRARAGDNVVDVVLIVGEVSLPETWSITDAGSLEKCLFASPKLAGKIGTRVEPGALRDIPFVTPINSKEGRFVLVNDDCPLGQNRRIGHEAYTIKLALQMAMVSEQLVFGPRIAAQSHLESGDLVEIQVDGWDEREPVHVVCHSDRVQAAEEKFIVDTVRKGLSA